jgi:hypothetical protein
MKHLAAKALALFVPLLPVFACQPESAQSTTPDASAVDAAAGGDADAALSTFPDTWTVADSPADVTPDAPLCSGHLPGFVPPPFHPKAIPACTTADIDAYMVTCGPSDTSPECLGWKADAANATCKACVLRQDHSGPLLFYLDGITVAEPNEGACIAAAGDAACGAKTDAGYSCLFEACGACPIDGGQMTGACYETVDVGDCKPFTDAQSACESTLTGLAVGCESTTGTFQSQMRIAITLLCGIPVDGGPSDSGTGDASEGGPTDAAHD